MYKRDIPRQEMSLLSHSFYHPAVSLLALFLFHNGQSKLIQLLLVHRRGGLCHEVRSILHLREGERGDRIVIQTAGHATYHTLPFTVELIRFTLTRYPGSASPSSYESELLVHVDGETRRARVYMNNVLDVKGYRFFQASYDPDECGTILSVNRDVAGRNITYTGYLMILAVGITLAILISTFIHEICGWFTDDMEIRRIVVSLVIPFVLYQLGDGLQVNFGNALRGIADVRPLMRYAFLCYIVVSLPLSYLFGFTFGGGPAGIWMAYPVALTLAGGLFCRRFLQKTR